MGRRKIPQEAIDFVEANYKTMAQKEMAKRLNRSVESIRWIITKHGWQRPIQRYSAETRDRALELYKTMTAKDTAQHVGVPVYMVCYWACERRVHHTPEAQRRIELENIARAHTPEARKKLSEVSKHRAKMERWRIASGLPQKTKMHFNVLPPRIYKRMSYACYHWNYFRGDDANSATLYYDEQTRRSDRFEERYSQKYGIKFASAMSGNE